MRILVSNDDGVYAPGVRALVQALVQHEHEVTVVCPDRERSATGHALTLHKPLRVDRIDDLFPAGALVYAVSGTPSDCVKLGLDALLAQKPDLVISGINRGANLGTDVLYSGTVSAAMEGTLEGFPSLAVSLVSYSADDFGPAARFISRFIKDLAQKPVSGGFLLNINVPAIAEEDICGPVLTQLGVRRYTDIFEKRTDPRGKTYYWLAGIAQESEEKPGTDVWAVRSNYISVTPLHFDLSDGPGFNRWMDWGLETSPLT